MVHLQHSTSIDSLGALKDSHYALILAVQKAENCAFGAGMQTIAAQVVYRIEHNHLEDEDGNTSELCLQSVY